MPGTAQSTPDTRLEAADRFYWALVESPADHGGLARNLGRVAQESLLQSQLLPPLDGLEWCVCDARPAEEHLDSRPRLLFCLQDLGRVEAAWSAGAMHYGPDSVPSSLGLVNDPVSLNLLGGRWTPKAIRRARATRWLAVGLLGVLAAAAVVAGIERRRARLLDEHAGSVEVENALLTAQRARSLADLLARRDQLRATRQRLEDAGAPGDDAGAALTALLTAWPSDGDAPAAQTDSLTVGGETITLQLVFFSREDATGLAQRLGSFRAGNGPAAQWTLAQPQISVVNAPAGQPAFRAGFRFTRSATTGRRTGSGGMP